jgi:hypothetical protein
MMRSFGCTLPGTDAAWCMLIVRALSVRSPCTMESYVTSSYPPIDVAKLPLDLEQVLAW